MMPKKLRDDNALVDLWMKCKFPSTNESLKAIITALSPAPDDKILSICGCGAQPLALLEYVTGDGCVVAVDNQFSQLKLAKEIAKLVGEKDVESLSYLDIAPRNDDYFLKKDRLENIARNFGNLRLVAIDVRKTPAVNAKFSKGYFSNAPVDLKHFYHVFEPCARVYVAFANEEKRKLCIDGLEQDVNRPNVLYTVDFERSEQACELEERAATQWLPVVFVRK